MKRRERIRRVGMAGIAARLGLTVLLAALLLGMAPAQSAQTAGTTALAPLAIYNYGWENNGTILGSYGNLSAAANVASGTDPIGPTTVMPHGGSAMLQVTESPHSGTPQGYIAFVENLVDGDSVTASFWGWDQTPGASPSLRIWAHWAQSGDVTSYEGSAGGSPDYTAGTGWSQLTWTWTLDTTANPTADALVVEVRLYSTPSEGDFSTDYWIDDLQVEAPDTATVTFPPDPTAVTLSSLGASSGGLVAVALCLAMVLTGGGYLALRRRR